MNKQILVFIAIFLVSFCETTKEQEIKLDSLEDKLKLYKYDDTIKVNLLIEIACEAFLNEPEKTNKLALEIGQLSEQLNYEKGKAEYYWLLGQYNEKPKKKQALEYYLQAMQIAEKIKNQKLEAKYYNSLGMIYRGLAEKDKAFECLQKAVKISEGINDRLAYAKYLINLAALKSVHGNNNEALNDLQNSLKIIIEFADKPSLAKCYNSFGVIYFEIGNNPLSLDYLLKSLKIYENQNDKTEIVHLLINLSAIYRRQEENEKALDLLFRALKMAEELNDMQWIPVCLDKTGETYSAMNNPKALEYFNRSLAIAKELGDNYKIMNANEGIGDFYLHQKKYTKAIEAYNKALQKAQEVERDRSVCDIFYKLGKAYLKLDEKNKALNFTQKSLVIAKKYNMLNAQQLIYYQLSQIDSANRNYKQAYYNYKLHTELNDSIFNKKNTKKITEMELINKFEKEKQLIEFDNQSKIEVQEAKAKMNRIIIILLILSFSLVSYLAIILYRSYLFKSKTNAVLQKNNIEIGELNDEYLTINEELKQTNEQLFVAKKLVEESEEKLKVIIENSNDILVLVNAEGEQFFISNVAEKHTGYTVEELLGNIDNVIYPDDVKLVQEHWHRLIVDKNATDSIQYRHKHKQKGYVWFEVVAQNFLDNPALNAIVANVRNITERKEIEKALEESESEKKRLLQFEINRIITELESNQKALTVAALKLVQNAERDTQTILQLKELECNTTDLGKKKIATLITNFKRETFNSNWTEFELLFEKIHTSFYHNLNARFPKLTANERKICAFLKLNMSNKDIAQITFQSEDALKKARLRLRQKLGLERDINLVTFLQSI